MRHLVTAVLLYMTVPLAQASYHATLGGLHPDKLRVLAPTGDYELWNEDEIFVINPRGIDGSFFSDDIPELKDSIEHTAKYAIWNPDGKMVAVCVRTAKDTEETFVLLRQSESSYKYLRLPEDLHHFADEYNGAETVPLRWINARTLVVEVSGPYGGKSDDRPVYAYSMTARFDPAKHQFTMALATKLRDRFPKQSSIRSDKSPRWTLASPHR